MSREKKTPTGLVAIDVIRVEFFQDDTCPEKLKRCNQAIRYYTVKIPAPERRRYRIHLKEVNTKRAKYGVYFGRDL